MTMGDEAPVTSLVLPVLLRPILSQVNFRYNNAKCSVVFICNTIFSIYS